jgi:hypothetical protein
MALIFGSKTTRANAGVGNTTTVGAYTVHTFTASGNFTPATTGFVDILLIGGGGGHYETAGSGSGGGGAGGILFKKFIPVTASTPYPISIGSSGAIDASNGGNTTFTYSGITTTAYGGGKGGVPFPAIQASPSPFASGGGAYGAAPSPGPTIVVAGAGASVYGIGFPGYKGVSSGGIVGQPGPAGGGGGGAGGGGVFSSISGSLSDQPIASGITSCRGGPGVPIAYMTGNPLDIAGKGGDGSVAQLPVTSPTTWGYGGGNAGWPGIPAKPGVAYIRYI